MRRLFAFLSLILSSHALACPDQFICSGGTCVRAPVATCGSPAPHSTQSVPAVTVSTGSVAYGPQHSAAFLALSTTRQVGQNSSIPTTASTIAPPSQPAYVGNGQNYSGYGCAENGSCYGDISSVNGMPKTVHVNGYYRSDGTYVRGHYRSSGRSR